MQRFTFSSRLMFFSFPSLLFFSYLLKF